MLTTEGLRGAPRVIPDKLRRSLPRLVAPILLVALAVADIAVQPGLLSVGQIGLEVQTALPLVLLSFAQTLAMLMGALDLSIGGIMVVTNVLVATWLGGADGADLWRLLIVVAFGCAMGAANGIVIVRLKLVPFVATLATWSIFDGIALIILPTDGGTVPNTVAEFVNGSVAGIPTSIIILAGLLALWAYVKRTRFGLAIYAIGSDEERARLSGVRVDRVKVACFVIGGGLAGLGGVYLAGMTSTGTPTAGDSYILLTFAAVVIGGTSLRGGSGGLGLSVVGAFIEIIISDLVLAENLATWVATLASALLLLAVITIQALASKELARGAT